MNALRRIWDHFEEGFIAFLLTAMTLVTFVYVVLNNLYAFFFWLGDTLPFANEACYAVGDMVIEWTYAMTWSNALTKALFAWLLFFGISYGVRTAGHIGVDALVKLAPPTLRRQIALLACGLCLAYVSLLGVASFEWVATLLEADIGAEDLGHMGIKQWHITLIVPVGFFMALVRFGEIFYRIWTGQQSDLGLADEAGEAMKLTENKD